MKAEKLSTTKQAVWLIGLFLLASCAPNLGKTIEAPQIPAVATKGDARPRLGTYISIQSVEDARIAVDPGTASMDGIDYTEPQGAIGSLVENGLKAAFRENGISVIDSAPLVIRAEVRTWRAHTETKAQSDLASEATLYVEVIDPAGKKLFNGTYNGNRASTFPIITRVDVQDSLGIAMANAISQAVVDPQLLTVLSSY